MLTVRPATPTDAADVVTIRVRSWQDAYAGIMPADVLMALDDQVEEQIRATQQRWSSTAPRRFTTLVAVDDAEQVIGFVTYGPYRLVADASEIDPAAGEVLLIYVDPHRQGLGAGRGLMDAAVARLREAGVGKIRLWVLAENAAARRFYERYGFEADGETHEFRVTRTDGTPVDLPEVRYTLGCP